MSFADSPKRIRDNSLDFLRGLAVILMVSAHTIHVLHGGGNEWLTILMRTANTVVFSLFLFVSSCVSYFSLFLRTDEHKKTYRHIVKRTITLMLAYYIVAAASFITHISTSKTSLQFKDILELLAFIRVPAFSEFFLPFIFLLPILSLGKPLFSFTLKNLPRVSTLATLAYVTGTLLYFVPLGYPWREIKSLFAGSPGLLRFPILQYMPIILMGLWWGYVRSHKTETVQVKRVLQTGIIMASFAILCAQISTIWPIPFLDPIMRWPPSLGFLSIGGAVIFFLLLVFPTVSTNNVTRMVTFVGKDSFDIAILHLLFLFVYQTVLGYQTDIWWVIVLSTAVILPLCVAISASNLGTQPSFWRVGRISFGHHGRYRVKRRYILLLTILSLITVYQLNTAPQKTPYGGMLQTQQVFPFLSPDSKTSSEWWYKEYRYRTPLHITNTSLLEPIKESETITFTLNTSELIEHKKLSPSGEDILIVYEQDGTSHIVPYTLDGFGTPITTITIPIVSAIYPKQKDTRYTVYYGSDVPQTFGQLSHIQPTSAAYTVQQEAEHMYTIVLDTNRRWFLKTTDVSYPLFIQVSFPSLTDVRDVEYIVAETNERGRLLKNNNGKYTAEIDISTLSTGTYTLRAEVETDSGTFQSPQRKIIVSEPIYIAWTLDWEGWDVADQSLDAIDSLSKKYGDIPVTHFFNPRIFLPSVVSPSRAEVLLTWLKSRHERFDDEIALHLHMHFDLIQAAGITPLQGPTWGYRSNEGYDVLTTAYTKEELIQLLNWSKKMFETHNLPIPKGYRAGGWYADIRVLEALKETGFTYDSSGREKLLWGGSKVSPWNLSSTQGPYYPSQSDQNVSGFDSLSLLEIPNNGGNTYEYTTDHLIRRFQDNYTGTYLSEKKAIVFLSHPQWYDREFPKLPGLFDFIDKHSYLQDNGPVVYVSLATITELWK